MSLLKDKQTLYKALTQTASLGDNSLMMALARDLVSEHREALKTAESNAPSGSVDFSDKKALKERVLQNLLDASATGSAVASSHLARLAGLEEVQQDIQIETVSFCDIDEDYIEFAKEKAIAQSPQTS